MQLGNFFVFRPKPWRQYDTFSQARKHGGSMKHVTLAPIFCIILISGCSLQKLTLGTMKPFIENSFSALYEEPDLLIAKTAIESDLKLLDAILKFDPQNSQLLLQAVQGYSNYALGFIEDDDPGRASMFYLRARNYGFKLLSKKKKFADVLEGDFNLFVAVLQFCKKKDVPDLFWVASAWGGWIMLNMSHPEAIAELPKVEAMMHRVLELDESYYFGSAHLFFGVDLMVKPEFMGGNPDSAQSHFKKCLSFSRQQYLLPYVFYAQYYAVRTSDAELFDSSLKQVIETDINIFPSQRLPNAIAKRKAHQLIAQKQDLF